MRAIDRGRFDAYVRNCDRLSHMRLSENEAEAQRQLVIMYEEAVRDAASLFASITCGSECMYERMLKWLDDYAHDCLCCDELGAHCMDLVLFPREQLCLKIRQIVSPTRKHGTTENRAKNDDRTDAEDQEAGSTEGKTSPEDRRVP